MRVTTGMLIPSSFALSILSVADSVAAFVSQRSIRSSFSLHAKAKQKNSKSSSSSGSKGGFGSTTGNAPSKTSSSVADIGTDDTKAFPALDPRVVDTLLPAAGESLVGDLSTEMYERLAGIYGFQSFNYLSNDAVSDDSLSWDNLLSTGTSSSPASMDFATLLSSTPLVEPQLPATPAALPLSNLPAFDKFRVLHVDPLVLAVENFFTPQECDDYILKSTNQELLQAPLAPVESRSKTVGKDALAAAQRTSTTWFHHFQNAPELMAKASRLLGLDDITRWEEPQTVRYRRDEKFTWHLDALAPSAELEKRGGQRVATLLVYLTDLEENEGGATVFRDLGGSSGGPLKVKPKKGSALLFFPAAGGIPNVPFDIRTLHCGEVVSSDAKNDKWIAQLWLRERAYTPTVPPNNNHSDAFDAISAYCGSRN